jgi:NADPH-dependent 2,4-dienoyl-CoA reductase/sulfur reductase-like enzyme
MSNEGRHQRAGPARVLVVGASASGLSTAEALRRKGYAGGIAVLGDSRTPLRALTGAV